MTSDFQTVEKWLDFFDAHHPPALWFELIKEEYQELREAIAKGDVVAVADACADLKWVICGFEDGMQFPADKVFREVSRSNFSKMGDDGKPVRREDGKIMKGPHYSPPDLAPLVGHLTVPHDIVL